VTSVAYGLSLMARLPGYEVVHIFSASYFSFVLAQTPAILVAKLFGKKVILNYRSGEAEDHLRRWRRTAIPTIRLADRLAVPSGYLVDVFAEFGLRACAIFNFVDGERFRFRERRPLRPVFLSNRNLEPLYNVGCTLRAFAVIQRRFPEARLTVAGDGTQRPELEQLARDLGLCHVEFIGRVAPELMPALYEAADVYLNSPNIDNMPGSIIEAFAAGIPVVSTNAGGIPYIVRDGQTGLLAERGDHEALATAAIRLLEDEELASRIIRNAQGDSINYRWEAVKEGWLELYRGLGTGGTAADWLANNAAAGKGSLTCESAGSHVVEGGQR
jgi:L-malate glycosyltransferase